MHRHPSVSEDYGVYSDTASSVAGQSDAGMTVPVAEGSDEVWHWSVCIGCSFSYHSLFFLLLSEYLFELGETFLHSLSPG